MKYQNILQAFSSISQKYATLIQKSTLLSQPSELAGYIALSTLYEDLLLNTAMICVLNRLPGFNNYSTVPKKSNE
jgi:hypothetical protein